MKTNATLLGTIPVVLAAGMLATHAASLLNGDFELGNTGFTSAYDYVAAPNLINTENQYTIASDPGTVSVYADWLHFGDHTSGHGNMLIANGSPLFNASVWSQTVPVQPNTRYRFSLWAAAASQPGQALTSLQTLINSSPAGSLTLTSQAGVWLNDSVDWFSGSATTAVLSIVDTTTERSWNDFVLDDIQFTVVPEPSAFALLSLGLSAILLLRRKMVSPTRPNSPTKHLLAICLSVACIQSLPATPAQWSVESGGNGHFYEAFLVPEGIDWQGANNLALAKGGYLATITSAQENNFVFGLVGSDARFWRPGVHSDVVGPWLGGFQPPGSPEPAGNWQWVTGEDFLFTNWEYGEPSNGWDTGEDRLIFWSIDSSPAPKWNDLYQFDPRTPPVAYIVESVPEPSATSLALLLTALAVVVPGRSRRSPAAESRRRGHPKGG